MNSKLRAFIRGSTNPKDKTPGCANLDGSDCIFITDGDDYPCLIEIGKACPYFEKAVLPTAEDIGKSEYMRKAYAKQIGLDADKVSASDAARHCPGCDVELKAGEKYCKSCRITAHYKTPETGRSSGVEQRTPPKI